MLNGETMKKAFDGKLFGFVSFFYSHAMVKQACKVKVIMQKEVANFWRMFAIMDSK